MQGGLESLAAQPQGIASLPYRVVEEEMVPTTGIASLPKQAEMLAEFGREGDTYIIHAAEGETVLPMEVLENNPRLKKMLFTQMEELGLEPERYIVGNELNSINPITGQPEFFFKKTLKKVGKLIKKALPVIGAVIGYNLMGGAGAGWGSTIGSAVGAGTGAKAAGYSTEDALKAAALAAAGARFGGARTGTDTTTALQGGQSALVTPRTMTSIPTGASGAAARNAAVTQKALSGLPQYQNLPQSAAAARNAAATEKALSAVSGLPNLQTSAVAPIPTGNLTDTLPTDQLVTLDDGTVINISKRERLQGIGTLSEAEIVKATTTAPPPEVGFLESKLPESMSGIGRYVDQLPTAAKISGGLAALSYLGAAAEEDKPKPSAQNLMKKQTTGADLLQQDPARYGFNVQDFVPSAAHSALAQYQAPRPFLVEDVPPAPASMGYRPYMFPALQNPLFQQGQVVAAASGGEIVGPGGPTTDSVPAMLSDGEFVFTAKAVEKAGNGDRRKGAARMYGMMRDLENGKQYG